MSLGYVPGLYNYVFKDKCTVAQSKNIYKTRIRKKKNKSIAGQTKLEI